MMRFRNLLCVAMLCLSSAVWAVDTDGDGVDDTADAFPANAEAAVDTDGDGMPDVVNLDAAPIIFTDQFGTGTFTAGGWTTSGSWNISGGVATISTTCGGSFCGQDYGSISKTITIPQGNGKLFFNVNGSLGASRVNFNVNGLCCMQLFGSEPALIPAGNQTIIWTARSGVFSAAYSVNLSAVIIRASSLVQDADDDNDGVLDVEDAFPLNQEASIDTDSDGKPDNIDVNNLPLREDFESGSVDGWSITTSDSTYTYFQINPSAYSGINSLYAGASRNSVTHNMTTITASKTFQTGSYVALNWKYNYYVIGQGTVNLDGVLSFNGTTPAKGNWGFRSYKVTPGFHVLSLFAQSSYYTGDYGSVYIDDLRYTLLEEDEDDDSDGVLDANDTCLTADFNLSSDFDNDGCDDAAEDWDDDNDGVPDTVDAAPLNAGDVSEIVLPLDGSYRGLRLESRQQPSP